jgi:hypothetical protein
MLKWIDKRSVLLAGKKTYKAGEVIPADVLSAERIEQLIKLKKMSSTISEKPEAKPAPEVKPVAGPVKRERKPKEPEPVVDEIEELDEVQTDESSDE